MSARSLHNRGSHPFAVQAERRVLPLSAGFFQIRKNGIECQSSVPIPEWTEMTVEVETSVSGRNMSCTGVVVACNGSRQRGYQVAMLFTGLTRQSRARLDGLALPTAPAH